MRDGRQFCCLRAAKPAKIKVVSRPVITIDGSRVSDLAGFTEEFNRIYAQFDVRWDGHNLDAFHDFLVWPEEEYVLVWKDSDLLREKLGHGEMLKWLERKVQHCHPSHLSRLRDEIEAAKRGEGQTMFDLLMEIIRSDRPYVELRLE
jgi:hypothetical protein